MAEQEKEFNPNSFNAVMGQVIERLKQGDNTMTNLGASIDNLNKTIGCLPCASHDERIKAVEEKKRDSSGFWRDVKISIISAFLGILATIGTYFIIGSVGG
jgi:hypothetical protein